MANVNNHLHYSKDLEHLHEKQFNHYDLSFVGI